ncbi:hypothetical protein [Ehrlichia muris]|uniref:hypothetical protein n=1 Tax=Ehrlichia muris TaxID=35795 RepID=UPI0037C0BA0E
MELMLLSYGDSQLALVPTRNISYDKALNLCYTPYMNLTNLLNPAGDSEFSQNLYRSKLTDYCVVNSPKLGHNVVFLYGSNPSCKPVYVALLQPIGFMHTLFQEGVILNGSNFVSAGLLDMSLSNLPSEEKTIKLFPTVISMVDIITRTSRPYLNQFSFFNSSGNLFYIDYKSTVLNSVNVDQAGNQTFYMKLQ